MSSKYNHQGLYNSYDKKHKERDALDYYATPTIEVSNILEIIQPNLDHKTILEPCCGGGHMVKGIADYCYNHYESKLWKLIATDIQKRDSILNDQDYRTGEEYDFLGDNYPIDKVDWIIMNPPYSTLEPFMIRSLEIAQEGILLLCRLQFLEGQGRYETILKDNPPNDVWVYVDRIKCYKNGDFSKTESSAQAYCWCLWNLKEKITYPKLHWIRRKDT